MFALLYFSDATEFSVNEDLYKIKKAKIEISDG